MTSPVAAFGKRAMPKTSVIDRAARPDDEALDEAVHEQLRIEHGSGGPADSSAAEPAGRGAVRS